MIPDRLFVAGSAQKAADGTDATEREADRIRREVAEAIRAR